MLVYRICYKVYNGASLKALKPKPDIKRYVRWNTLDFFHAPEQQKNTSHMPGRVSVHQERDNVFVFPEPKERKK